MALEALYGGQTDGIVVQLAHHYREAGRREKAVDYALRAGKQARIAYANEEATAYFSRALALLDDPSLTQSRKDWRLEALRGLGQVHYGMGKLAEAEERFQEAIALGREMGLAPRELVRLYHWLGEVLWWQSRYDDLLHIGREGLALLGDDTESVEAALMNQTIAIGHHWSKGNWERHQEFTYRTAQFIQCLPYSEELGPVYYHIARTYHIDKRAEEAMKWRQALEGKAKQHHDLKALARVYFLAGDHLAGRGDFYGTKSRLEQALELCRRIGDAKHAIKCLVFMQNALLSLGDLQNAEEYAHRIIETVEVVGSNPYMAWSHWLIGTVSLCRGAWEEAVEAFGRASQLFHQTGPKDRVWGLMSLGRTYLAQGRRQEALRPLQEAVALTDPDSPPSVFFPDWRPPFVGALSGLQEAYEAPHEFQAFCHRYREEHPEVADSPFLQWFLEPTEPLRATTEGRPYVDDEFVGTLSSDWVWQDPFDDCSFTVRNGLEIHAATGRDLWHMNLSAPRVLRSVSGDFAVQAVCVPVLTPALGGQKPAIGGLLLWKDRQNFLRLDRGIRGEHEISLEGCLGNQDVIIGRGRLESASRRVSGSSGRVFLRLERVGDRVNALCSADGERWFTVGQVAFPVEDPVQVGLHAIGNIDRTIYHGAYPEGTAIRFESFHLWGP